MDRSSAEGVDQVTEGVSSDSHGASSQLSHVPHCGWARRVRITLTTYPALADS